MKLFKNTGKKFKKTKRLKSTIRKQAQEIERLKSKALVKQQKLDLLINGLVEAQEK